MLFKTWKTYLDLLLLDVTKEKVLIISRDNLSYLPHIEINRVIGRNDFQAIKDEIKQILDISVNVLHYASYQIDKNQRNIQGIYVLELHQPSEKIQGATLYDLASTRFADRQTLANLSFINSEQKSLIDRYLMELESNNLPQFRPPWARPGWFREASAWIEEQLDNLECEQIAPIEYVKNWSISCVLKVKTSAGNLYLKEASTLPLFCDEPIVTKELASLFPQHIPTVLSIDRQRHWMLLKDFGEPLGRKKSLKIKQDIYRTFAQIPIQSVAYCDRLLEVGCLDRRLNILQSQIEPLVNDENALSELSKTEIEQLQSLVPTLKNLCFQLASYNIPETLVHGDLSLGNVALDGDNYIFFDWTDACISHPFFDLLQFFIESDNKSFFSYLNSFWQSKFKNRCRNLYLSQWEQYESREHLLEAWNIAKTLCILHHAVTYQHIIASLEPSSKSEFSYFLPRLLRNILSKHHDLD